MPFHIDVITPDQTVFTGDADSVTIPTLDGEITVLAHHAPLMGVLVPGTIVVRVGRDEQLFAVSRGAVEVSRAGVRLLAETADRAEALEEAAIEAAKAKAESLMTEKRHDAEGFAEATAILERELARLRTVRRHRARATTHPPREGE